MKLLFALAALPAFADVVERERALETDSREGRAAHTLAVSPESFRCDAFRHVPDFVVGVEKVSRRLVAKQGALNFHLATAKQRAGIRTVMQDDTLITHTLRLSR